MQIPESALCLISLHLKKGFRILAIIKPLILVESGINECGSAIALAPATTGFSCDGLALLTFRFVYLFVGH